MKERELLVFNVETIECPARTVRLKLFIHKNDLLCTVT
jgi:hypothetical protein